MRDFRGLDGFLQILDEAGDLKRIDVEVSTELEITEITNRIVKKGGPALFFARPEGYSIPVVTNLLGSEKRVSLSLRASSLVEVEKRVDEFLNMLGSLERGISGTLKGIKRLKEVAVSLPKRVKKGEFESVVLEGSDAKFSVLPVLKLWPGDAGRFITCPVVVVKDKDGMVNLGMYRMQVFDDKTSAVHWQIHKDGRRIAEESDTEKVPAAVVLGTDPLFMYIAACPVPYGFDDYMFSGLLSGKAPEITGTERYGIDVPADSEIVLEGYVDLGDMRTEGPFGDHTGFYTTPDLYPTFHLERIYMKKDPVFPAMVVGRPPSEDVFIGKATERIFLPFIKRILPEVVDWCFPVEGGFHNFLFVSIRKRFPGHAFKVLHGLWGLPGVFTTKNIVVFDEDINVHDISEVIWAWGNNADPVRDVIISKGPLDALDHASPLDAFGGKMGIDATSKWKGEGFSRPWPQKVSMSEDVIKLVEKRWKDYGL